MIKTTKVYSYNALEEIHEHLWIKEVKNFFEKRVIRELTRESHWDKDEEFFIRVPLKFFRNIKASPHYIALSFCCFIEKEWKSFGYTFEIPDKNCDYFKLFIHGMNEKSEYNRGLILNEIKDFVCKDFQKGDSHIFRKKSIPDYMYEWKTKSKLYIKISKMWFPLKYTHKNMLSLAFDKAREKATLYHFFAMGHYDDDTTDEQDDKTENIMSDCEDFEEETDFLEIN